jgi:SAM-dependent methyltransferase
MNCRQAVCRSCGKTKLSVILSLGQTPLANALLKADQLNYIEPTYPLNLVFCGSCGLVQITDTVPPERLFREYLYLSSFSDTMLKHSKGLVKRMIGEQGLTGESQVIEIGSNDGYLLQYYKQAKVKVLGIEPAKNIARIAQETRCIRTLDEFFSESLAKRLREEGQQADVIHAHNVLAHVADLNGMVKGIGSLLRDEGVAVIEVPYVKDLIERTEFDTIYHEHLCYFSFTALDRLFRRHHLAIQEVEHLSIHGGSLRLFVKKEREQEETTERRKASPSVQRFLDEEALQGLDRVEFYHSFAEKVERLRSGLLDLLKELKKKKKRIVAYGASAKGSTLLNYFGIGREILDYVVDRSTLKQGLFTPGTHLPIYAPVKLAEDRPEYVLLLTWNFAAEIMTQQAGYRQDGGKFIIPLPELKVL